MSKTTLLKLLDKRDEIKAELESLDQAAARKQAELLTIEQQTIPDLLSDMGVSNLTLEDGRKITIGEFVSVKIPDELKPAAHCWLQSKGYGDLVKHVFTVNLTAGDAGNSEASSIRKTLEDRGVPFSEEEKVHPMTLKAFVAEQLEAGTVFPESVFKIHQGKIARVKASKSTE